MHAIADRALQLVHSVDGQLMLSDVAIDTLADAWGEAVDRGEAFEVAGALLMAATTLLARPEGSSAGRTLFALVLAAQPGLLRLDARRGQLLQARTERAAAQFGAFAGAHPALRPLDSGARPAGTVAAGPLARFACVSHSGTAVKKKDPP